MTAELAGSHQISVEDYLASEELSVEKREYIARRIYVMDERTNAHSAVATNLLIVLGEQLRENRCRPLNSDMKLRMSNSSAAQTHRAIISRTSLSLCSRS